VVDCGVDFQVVTDNVATHPILQAGDAGVSYWMVMDISIREDPVCYYCFTFLRSDIPEPYDAALHSGISPKQWERRCECTQLPFCDWLDVSMDRWRTQVDEIYHGEAEYDEELKRWKDDTYRHPDDGRSWPVPDGGLDAPLVIFGGNMKRFTPITPPLAPLVSLSYAFQLPHC